ncbi:MAG: hypothetical protein LBP96_01780 [Bacteroidales bacterium]|jgi:hypothetical protein|nr:hypothetical protein [Bacteroidales bacterium]
MKKLLFAIATIGVLFAACGKDKDAPKSEVEKLLDLPYSKLTPAQQKAKLEQESIDFLEELRGLQNLPAIDAIEHFNDLLDRHDPNVPSPLQQVSDIKEVFNLGNVTGVFTWNRTTNRWTEETSTTELKFIFPATSTATTNNATLVFTSENSGVTITETWEHWEWDYETWEYIITEIETVYYLPKAAKAVLTIGSKEEAVIEFGADYKSGEDVPIKAIYKMSTGGYVYQTTVDKVGEEKISMKLSRGNKMLVSGVAKTTAKLGELEDLLLNGNDISDEDIYKRLGEADAYIKLMDNLVVAYKIETEKWARAMDAYWIWDDNKYDELRRLEWGSPQYWTLYKQYQKERVEKRVKILNDFMNAALVSTKDNYKIADMVWVAERDNEYDWWYNYYYQQQVYYYNQVIYLKFNDNTLIAADVYFGDGFDRLIEKFEELLDGFGFGK